jgi:hypothetical protein
MLVEEGKFVRIPCLRGEGAWRADEGREGRERSRESKIYIYISRTAHYFECVVCSIDWR